MIECLASGLVYRNPRPHLKSVHAWHPTLVRLADGELVAAFDLGEAVESLDYRTYLARSQDGGKTWSPPVRLLEDAYPRPSTHTVRLGQTADGTIVGFGGRHHRDDPNRGLVNRENLGFTPMDLILVASRDGGRTWDGPHTIEPPLVGPSFEICHRILELSDGRWLAPTATWKDWEGNAPNGMKAIALVSHDRGRTWPEYLTVMDASDRGIVHWEQSIVELDGGRLLAVAWELDQNDGQTRPTPYAMAEDGRTFSEPKLTGMHGQTAKLLRLADGRIFCLYRRNDQPGLWANLARIDGDRWIQLEEATMWQGAASGMAGKEAIGEELSALKFGFPSMVQLPEGDVLAVFWCAEDCIHNIRWLRIRVS